MDKNNLQRCEIEKLVKSLVAGSDDQLKKFKKLMQFDDCRYLAMKFISNNLKKNWKQEDQRKVLSVIRNLQMSGSAELNNFKFSQGTVKMTSIAEHKRLYTGIWLDFLRQELPISIHKEVLAVLPDVMPFMTSPLQMSDYLTESYNMGGVLSLLALNGIFILVNHYNFEYPNFYEKVYSLLEPGIFHVKYRLRFLYLLNLFLSSTHIPAYYVAAFLKKMSRLSLAAPPEALLCVLPMLRNWLITHPACKVLINRPGNISGLDSDPFDQYEVLGKCRAMESSLWEVKCLQEHYHSAVADKAKKFDSDVINYEPLDELFEQNVDEMINKEIQKPAKKIHVNPPGLARCSMYASEFWSM